MSSARATVRPPAVAGTFYPADARALRTAIDAAFADARVVADAPVPKALVAPHAGYVYSGAIAASAYERVRPARDRIGRVVLLGPAHRAWVDGVAASSAHLWRTPLGDVRIEHPTGIPIDDDAQALEHSLEVHVPFLQTLFDDVTLVPLVVGHAEPNDVAAVLEQLWGGDETLIVVSTDLSHYHDYDTASSLDRRTAAHIAARAYRDLGDRDACGFYPLRGLLLTADRRQLEVELLDLRNSGDTAGSHDRVVGYGAFAVAGSR